MHLTVSFINFVSHFETKKRHDLMKLYVKYDSEVLTIAGKDISFTDFRDFVEANFPHTIKENTVRSEVTDGRIVRHVDWQNIYGNRAIALFFLTN